MKWSQLKVGAILSYVALFLNIIISLIYTPFMLRTLGQAEYGVLSLALSLVSNLAILDLGFGNAIIRYTTKYAVEKAVEKEKTLHFMFVILYTLIGFVSFIIGCIIIVNMENIFNANLTYEEIDLARKLMIVGVISISISFPLGIFGAIIQAYQRHIFIKLLNAIKVIIMPVVLVLTLIGGFRSLGIMIGTLVITLIFNLIDVYYFYRRLNKRIYITKLDFSLFKSIGTYSFFVFLNIIISKLYWATDQIIIGMYSGSVAVSVYSIGAQFNNYFMRFSTSLSGLFLPKIVELNTSSRDNKSLSELFVKVGRLQILLLTLVLSGFFIFGKEFITIWAGIAYKEAYYVAMIVMVTALIPLSQNIGIGIIQAKKLHAFRSISFLFIAIFNIVLSIILVKPYGIVGCAIATGIANILGQGLLMNFYYKHKVGLDITAYWQGLFRILVPVVILVAINHVINLLIITDSYKMLFMKIIIFTIEYCIVLWLFSMNRNEKNMIVIPIRKILGKSAV